MVFSQPPLGQSVGQKHLGRARLKRFVPELLNTFNDTSVPIYRLA